MIRCPACDREMREVSVPANPGTLIVLDQCGACGGIWCDKWELFPVQPSAAKRLESLDEALLNRPVELNAKPLYCPRCTEQLQFFHDPLLPREIQLQRCRRCDGIWLNRGQLSRYKNFQQKTRGEKMPREERLRRVVESVQNPSGWVTTGTQGMFAYPRGESASDDWKSDTLKGAFRLILQSLLRLVVGI